MTPDSPKYCPNCNRQGMCINSRHTQAAVMRRYKCRCGQRWNTRELAEGNPDIVRGNRPRFSQLRHELNAAIDRFFESHMQGG